jgi:hypothetical protein
LEFAWSRIAAVDDDGDEHVDGKTLEPLERRLLLNAERRRVSEHDGAEREDEDSPDKKDPVMHGDPLSAPTLRSMLSERTRSSP